jgi:hypothetical protein
MRLMQSRDYEPQLRTSPHDATPFRARLVPAHRPSAHGQFLGARAATLPGADDLYLVLSDAERDEHGELIEPRTLK